MEGIGGTYQALAKLKRSEAAGNAAVAEVHLDEAGNILDIKEDGLVIFGFSNKNSGISNFFALMPEFQPNGKVSETLFCDYIKQSTNRKNINFEWVFKRICGKIFQAQVHLCCEIIHNKKIIVCMINTDSIDNISKMEEGLVALLDHAPGTIFFINEKLEILECNQHALEAFSLKSKEEFAKRFFSDFAPKFQNSIMSEDFMRMHITRAFSIGNVQFGWNVKRDYDEAPGSIRLVSTKYQGNPCCIAYLSEFSIDGDLYFDEPLEDSILGERMWALLDGMPFVWNFLDMDLNCLDCNLAAVKLFGFKDKQEFIKRFYETLPANQPCGKDTFIKAKEYINEVLEKGNIHFEWMHQLPDGTEVPSDVTLIRVGLKNRFILAAFVRDLRQEKALEAIRNAEEAQIRTIIDSIPAVCTFWNEDRNLILCNQGAADLFELSCPQEYLERFGELSPAFQPCGTNSMEKAIAYVNQAFETGKSQFDWMHQKPDGTPIPSIITLTRVRWLEGYGLVGFTIDQREQYAVKQERKYYQDAFYTILNNVPLAVHFWDKDSNLVYSNNRMVELLGFNNQDHYMQDFFSAYPEKQPCGRNSVELTSKLLMRVFETGSETVPEWILLSHDKKPIPVECTLVRVKWGDDFAVLEFIRDLREQYKEREIGQAYQERLRLLIDNMPMVSNFRDEDLNIVDCNQAALDLFELNSKEEYIERFLELSPQHQPCGTHSKIKSEYYIRTAFKDGKITFDWMHQKPDGTPIPAQVTLMRVEWQGKSMLCAFVQDMREHIAARREQRVVEERLKAMIDASPNCCYIIDRRGRIVDCNKMTLDLLGVKDKYDFNKRFKALHPEKQASGEVSAAAIAHVMKRVFGNTSNSFEWTFKNLSGDIIPAKVDTLLTSIDGNDVVVVYVIDRRDHYRYMEDQRIAKERMDAMLNSSPLACFVTDFEYNVLDCNQVALQLFGLGSNEEFYARFMELQPENQPDGQNSKDKMRAMDKRIFDYGKACFEWMHLTASGEELPVEVTGQKVTLDGRDYAIIYLRDLREQVKFAAERRIARERLLAMLDSSPLACFILDKDLSVLTCNESVVNLFGLKNKENFIENFTDIFPETQPDGMASIEKARAKVAEAFLHSQGMHFEWMHQAINGDLVPCEITLKPVILDDSKFIIAYIQDLRKIRQAVNAAEALEKLAYTDSLTGAHNRRYFMDSANRDLQKSMSEGTPFSLIMMDIDNFKIINDTYGHVVGDGVLKILVSRVRHSLRKDVVVARYGGEEFIIMLPGMSVEDAEKTAWRIRKRIENSTFMVEGMEVPVTLSLGVSGYYDGDDLTAVIVNTDKALYEAKSRGKNTVVTHDHSLRSRLVPKHTEPQT